MYRRKTILKGWLINLIVILLGLGAPWFFGRDLWSKKAPAKAGHFERP